MTDPLLVTTTSKVMLPSVPATFSTDTGAQVPISHFTEEQLSKIGAAWVAKLIQNAEMRRAK